MGELVLNKIRTRKWISWSYLKISFPKHTLTTVSYDFPKVTNTQFFVLTSTRKSKFYYEIFVRVLLRVYSFSYLLKSTLKLSKITRNFKYAMEVA